MKDQLIIQGYSDDNLSFEGCINDEVGCYHSSPVVSFPDGTVIAFEYDEDGIWRAEIEEPGTYEVKIEKGDVEKDTNDIVTVLASPESLIVNVDGDITVLGEVTLDDDQEELFTSISDIMHDSEEFEERSNMIKLAIKGVRLFEGH
jgi:predicted neuraminidase